RPGGDEDDLPARRSTGREDVDESGELTSVEATIVVRQRGRADLHHHAPGEIDPRKVLPAQYRSRAHSRSIRSSWRAASFASIRALNSSRFSCRVGRLRSSSRASVPRGPEAESPTRVGSQSKMTSPMTIS